MKSFNPTFFGRMVVISLGSWGIGFRGTKRVANKLVGTWGLYLTHKRGLEWYPNGSA